MLYNKNNVRKTNDKKILHKVGKQWKVISVALLMAIGGGAAVAASNNNANADATDNAYNDAAGVTNDTAAQAQSLENNNFYGGSAKPSSASSASKVTAKPSFANINYAPSERYAGNNASAASYRNNQSFDAANIDYYGPIVKGYIDQINAKYPQARSLEASYSNYQGKANNAKSAANSYSATAQNSNTANVISAKAKSAHQTTSDYTDSVAYHVLNQTGDVDNWGFIPKVSYAANEASQDSVVESYANLIYDINNNTVVSDEYNAKAHEADAQSSVTSDYAKNALNYVNQITNDSANNQNSYNSNISDSISLSANEQIAQYNSTEDAEFVSSAASNAGFKFTSSVVSSAISSVASLDNKAGVTNTNDSVNATSVANGFNNQVQSGAGYIEFSANGQTGSAYKVSVGNTSAYYEATGTSNASADALIRTISDTATQEEYSTRISGLNSDIAAEKANMTSYANELSSANDAYTRAKASSSVASSVAQADDILGDKPVDQDIFIGRDADTTTTYYSYNANSLTTGVINNSSLGKDALSLAGITNASSASNKASSAVSSAASMLVSLGSSLSNETSTDTNTSAVKSFGTKSAEFNIVSNAGLNSTQASFVNSLVSADSVSSEYSTGANYASNVSSANNALNSVAKQLQSFSNLEGTHASSVVSSSASENYKPAILNSASYSAAYNDLGAYLHDNGGFGFGDSSAASSVASAVASTAASAGSNYNSVSSASNSYAKATDQDVTIASQFNSYYNSIASSNATLASNAKQSLDTFRATHASNPTAYTSASDAYTSASNAEPNDRDFAYAYGKNVLLNTPEYITVKKGAMLHNATQYAKANAVEGVKAGDQFGIIKGVGFDKQGNVRYVVADPKGKNYYITANDAYVKNTYLAPSVNYTIKLDKDAVAHSTLGFHKDAEGTVPAGTQVDGYTVPTSTNSGRRDAAYGVTRLQIKGGKFNGDYITTNCKYLDVVSVNGGNEEAANQQNTNPVQNTINFAD